jgi:hypothetical protein
MGVASSKSTIIDPTPTIPLDENEIIELQWRKLKSIPDEIVQRGSKVSKLIMDFNELAFAPDDKSLEAFPNIVELSLASNHAQEITEDMLALKRLEILNLGANKLKCILIHSKPIFPHHCSKRFDQSYKF